MNHRTKLASVTVVFHFPPDELKRNLDSYADNVDFLIVWDNTPASSANTNLPSIVKEYPNAIIIQDGVNHGLPKAYNYALQMAIEHGCTHLMTMDQDSTFENFKDYRQQIEFIDDSSVGIFTCPINNDIQVSGYRDTTVCQSGSIYTMEMLRKVGGFREDLFIGMVDAEMSLRVIEKGYKIYQIANCNLVQRIGSGRNVKFLGKKINVSDYGPLRHYYESRNRFLLWYEFPYDSKPVHKWLFLFSRLKLMVKILFFEKEKLNKCKAIVSGTWHGLRNQTTPFK